MVYQKWGGIIPDIATGFSVILNAVEVKDCFADPDAVKIPLFLRSVLTADKITGGNGIHFISVAVQVKNVLRKC
jgi:hypothetical protein